MKKLSSRMRLPSNQALVLFNDVLDGEKLLLSPEIEKLATHFYGQSALSIVQVENPERLHDWLRDEQYKADCQERSMIYPVKATFESLTLDTHSDEFSGPLYVQIFLPSETVFNVLTITCKWYDGLFRNDYYVIGAIVDAEDLNTILDRLQI
ncbi:MAG: hypothetical protein IKQ20_06970 [Bacteroidales bacterium]|nr:hypothetical protein [Bacteroidales bacterium]